MVNKNLLPLKFRVPIFGETIFLTRGLKYNMEFLLFWGPWAPFDNSWHLRDDYKNTNRRKELAKDLSKVIGYIGNEFLQLSAIQHVIKMFFIIFLFCIFFLFSFTNRCFKSPFSTSCVTMATAVCLLQLCRNCEKGTRKSWHSSVVHLRATLLAALQ